MSKHPKVALLSGGMSAEREVSLATGRAFAEALRQLKYDFVEIDAQEDLAARLLAEKPGVVLLALHGKYAEDGTVQGLCEYLKIPYTGTGVLGSALCMDKVLSKQLAKANGIPTADFEFLQADHKDFKNYQTALAYPVVVKPSREGSSVGVSICHSPDELPRALALAAASDKEILIEVYLEGPEITVPILANKALTPIEIRPKKGFYDYKNKYTSGCTEYLLPPQISLSQIEHLQQLALKTHNLLRARVYSRVDFRLHKGNPFLLEVNTLPGCTPTSLLPKSAAFDGIEFKEVVRTLVERATLDYEGVR